MPRFLLVRLFCSLWVTYLVHFQHLAAGSDRFVFLAMAMVEQGTFQLDAYQGPFLTNAVAYNGHLYSNLNPGLAFLAAFFWAIIVPFYQLIAEDAIARQPAIHYFLAHLCMTLFTTSLFTALASCLLARIAIAKTGVQWRGLLAAGVYGIGSTAFFFATHLNQNIAIAALIVCIYAGLFTPHLLRLQNMQLRALFLGFCLGFGVCLDNTMLPLVVLIALFIVLQYRQHLQDLVLIVLGAIAPLGLLIYYQAICFGEPLLNVSSLVVSQLRGTGQNLASEILREGINFPGIWQHLFSLQAGLLFFWPASCLMCGYLMLLWSRENRMTKLEKTFIVTLTVGCLFSIAVIPQAYIVTRFGPRYLLPVLPLFCLVVATYFPRRPSGVAIALLGWGFFINLAGAQRGELATNALQYGLTYLLQIPSFPMLQWIQNQVALVERFNLQSIQPGGLLIIWLGILLAIWFPLLKAQFIHKSSE